MKLSDKRKKEKLVQNMDLLKNFVNNFVKKEKEDKVNLNEEDSLEDDYQYLIRFISRYSSFITHHSSLFKRFVFHQIVPNNRLRGVKKSRPKNRQRCGGHNSTTKTSCVGRR